MPTAPVIALLVPRLWPIAQVLLGKSTGDVTALAHPVIVDEMYWNMMFQLVVVWHGVAANMCSKSVRLWRPKHSDIHYPVVQSLIQDDRIGSSCVKKWFNLRILRKRHLLGLVLMDLQPVLIHCPCVLFGTSFDRTSTGEYWESTEIGVSRKMTGSTQQSTIIRYNKHVCR